MKLEKMKEEKLCLKKRNEQLKRTLECSQNALHLAAAVLIQIEAKDEKITNVKECEGCDKCGGFEGCYLIEIQK